MKKTLSVAVLSLLMSLPVICHAELLEKHFIVEVGLEQNKKSFSIKRDPNTLSYNPSYFAGTNDDAGLMLPPDNKVFSLRSYGVTVTPIESISWQLIYATNLLVAYKLVLTIHGDALSSKPFSWLPVEALAVVGGLLKSNWNTHSPLFNPMDQLEASQDQPFAITTMVLPGNDQKQNRQTASPSQQASGTTNIQMTGSVTETLFSGSGRGNEDPKQPQHTFGLHCHVDSCHGVCKLRSSNSNDSAEGTLNSEESLGASPGQASYFPSEINQLDSPKQSNVSMPGSFSPASSSMSAGKPSTTGDYRFVCNGLIHGANGLRLCGMLFKSYSELSSHKKTSHAQRRKYTCGEKMLGEDGHWNLCRWTTRTLTKLYLHKRLHHSGPQSCDIRVAGEDGKPKPCGEVFNNAQELLLHKRRHRTNKK